MNLHDRRVLLGSSAYSLCALSLLAFSLLGWALPAGEAYSLWFNLLNAGLELLVMGIPLAFLLCFPCARSAVSWKGLLRRPSAAVWLIVPIAFFGYFAINGITVAWLGVLGLFGPVTVVESVPIPKSGAQLLLGVLVIGLCPAAAEELFFRGALQSVYGRIKPAALVVLVGTLFGILHGQLMALPAHVLLGVLLCLLVYWTQSLWPALLLHLLQNSLSLAMALLSERLLELYSRMGMGELVAAQQDTLLAGGLPAVLSGGVMAVSFLLPMGGLLCLYLYLTRNERKKETQPPAEEKPASLRCFLPLIPGLLVSLFLYVGTALAMYGAAPMP